MIQEREINIASIARVMWERGKKIGVFSFSAMLIGAVATLLIHNRYEAEATLFVNVSKLGVHLIDRNNNQTLMDAYWRLVPSKKSLMDMIRDYHLKERPYRLKYAKDLEKRIEVESVEENMPIFTISVEMEDATMAATIANRVAKEAVDIADKIRRSEKDSSTKQIGLELGTINQTVEGLRTIYLEKLNKNLKPKLIQDLSVNYSFLATYKQELDNLNNSILELETRKQRFEEVLSATDLPRTIVTRSLVVDDPLLLKKLESRQGDFPFEELGNLVLYREELNGIRQQLEMEYRKLLVDLPTMVARREFAVEQIDLLSKVIDEEQVQLNYADTEELIAKADFDRSLEVMSGIDKQAGWAGTTVTTERLDVFEIHPAIPDTKKVFPRRSLMVLLIGMIAFLTSLIYYLLTDLYGLVRTGIQAAPVAVQNNPVT